MTSTPDILVLFAHLAIGRSKINRALRDAVADLPRVRVHDLLETYPDFYIDAAREQALLRDADLVVFQHPIYWHGLPAIMKHWLDVVLTRGFAFGPGSGALHGKALMHACSTGAPESAYRIGGEHHAPIGDLLLPLATLVTPNLPEAARLSGLPVETEAERAAAARRLTKR